MRIFLSHATADLPLIKEFVPLLKEIGVPNQNIFCTSLPGHGVPAGLDFKSHIAQQFQASDAVIAIITPSYYESAFSMCELGATWITAKKRFFPILVPPIDYSDLKAVLVGVQCLKIEKAKDLSELRDYLHDNLEHPCNTPMWEESRDRFLEKLTGIFAKLPKAPTVPSATYEKAQKDLDEYRAEVKRQKAKLESLEKEKEEISKLKDIQQVRKVSQSFKSEEEKFRAVINNARDAIKGLPLLVREALFHYSRNEDFAPDWNEWGEEPLKEIQRGRLRESGEENQYVSIDKRDQDIDEALSAFDELTDFVARSSKEFKKAYEQQCNHRLDPLLRPFWHKWFKLSG